MTLKGHFTLSKVSSLFSGSAGLAILHCVVADGNTTRTPETNGSLCGAPGENCTGNFYASYLVLET
jgi:betacellulin